MSDMQEALVACLYAVKKAAATCSAAWVEVDQLIWSTGVFLTSLRDV